MAPVSAGSPASGSADEVTRAIDAPESLGVPAPEPLQQGATVGRYVVLGRLGSGGMGIVHRAYDPTLQREVAIKLLRPRSGGSGPASDGAARLLREAQALAKLSHPNVVPVYDVGSTDGGDIWVAMEAVRGQTLKAWLREASRSWREVVAVLLQAGRGLAAAHAAGLVHRDFKPANVMIGDDGRVRVMDFGLARADRSRGSMPVDSDPERSDAHAFVSSDGLDSALTEAGMVMGTPAYMAPEQCTAAAADARSDQFAFCVALYEALYGFRPFRGDGMREILANVREGAIEPVPRDSAVPKWVRDVAVRGLAVDPTERWSDMDTLLRALARDPSQQRRRVLLGVGIAATCVGTIAGIEQLRAAGARVCAGADEDAATVWHEERADALAALVDGAAADRWAVARTRIDEHAQAWVAMRTEACEATRVRGEQSDDLMDRRMVCLDRRLAELDAALEVFEQHGAAALEKATDVLEGLRPLADCGDKAQLLAQIELPADPEIRAQVTTLQRSMAKVRALSAAGRYDEGLALAATNLQDAEATGHAPLHAAALEEHGSLLDWKGEHGAAIGELERAYWLALRAGDDDVAIAAGLELVHVLGSSLTRFDDALQWAHHTEALIDRLDAQNARAHLEGAVGGVYFSQLKHAEAFEHFERAVRIKEELGKQDTSDYAVGLVNLANACDNLGRADEAIAYDERAIAIWAALYGPDHPHIGITLFNMGFVMSSRERLDEAMQYWERSYDVLSRALGPNHPNTAEPLRNIGVALADRGEHERALVKLQTAREILEAALGPEHRRVAVARSNIGSSLAALGRYDEAMPHLFAALEIRRKSEGPEHPDVARSLATIALVERDRGEHAQALAHAAEAVAIAEKSLPSGDPEAARWITAEADVLLSAGRASDAVPRLEKAIAALAVAPQENIEMLSTARFLLARALVETDGDRARARQLAEEARGAIAELGHEKEQRAEIDAWLRAH